MTGSGWTAALGAAVTLWTAVVGLGAAFHTAPPVMVTWLTWGLGVGLGLALAGLAWAHLEQRPR